MVDPKWIIERLGKHHDRSQFDCGIESLDDFLKTRATQFEKRDLGRTFVAIKPAEAKVVLGYYTLASGSVSVHVLPSEQRAGLPERMPVPVLHLGRLAVRKGAQGKGLGSYLLMDALARGLKHASEIAMRAVEVVAINDEARQFYVKYGFSELMDDKNHLYVSMKTVEALLVEE